MFRLTLPWQDTSLLMTPQWSGLVTPAEKLRLARALKLAGDLGIDKQLDSWIEDHEAKRSLRWLTPEEGELEQEKKRELEGQRRKAHDQLLARVDELTRTQTTRRVL